MASAFYGLQDEDDELMKQDAEIEKLTFGDALKKLEEHNIDFTGKESKIELRRELKLKLLCKTTRKEVCDFLFSTFSFPWIMVRYCDQFLSVVRRSSFAQKYLFFPETAFFTRMVIGLFLL